MMKEADYYTRLKSGEVKCTLCPFNCLIPKDKYGACRVRENRGGVLFTHIYDQVAALHFDPIEKKPLYHFFPGKTILSIGGTGCNLHCNFCQNFQISQCYPDHFQSYIQITGRQVVDKAVNHAGNIGVAYTYNEPFTFYEFLIDTATLVKQAGLYNVVVSNGYINPGPLKALLPNVDAFNIDLKAFTDQFYIKETKGRLAPVLETLRLIVESGTHLEITHLLIPGLNDNLLTFEKMLEWIARLNRKIPLHISRYFPNFKRTNRPTEEKVLAQYYAKAKAHLDFVYVGNLSNRQMSETRCPRCNETRISRYHYQTEMFRVDSSGQCAICKEALVHM